MLHGDTLRVQISPCRPYDNSRGGGYMFETEQNTMALMYYVLLAQVVATMGKKH